jgi:glucosyl-dolichyl phosphate glucuronosyltransferase
MTDTNAGLDFSVIICAYTEERWEDLLGAIKSVQHQIFSPKEIIVVIDHNPVLVGRLRSHLEAACPAGGVIVIENAEPKGLSGARNSGLAVARGGVIAFLDDDAVAAPDWLARLSEGYRQPQVLGVGGAIEPLWLTARPRWFPAEFDWVVGCTYLGMPLTAQPVRNLIGCNMSFRSEVFKAVGGFRSGIGRVGKRPVGCEETELCIRAGQKWPGMKFIYNPQAKVQHRVPASRANWNYFRARCYAEGLSKALVTQLVGAADGLYTERSYILKTLPGGLGRGVLDTLGRSDFNGLGRSGAIATGLGITALGYITGKLFNSISKQPLQLQPLQNESPSPVVSTPEKIYVEAGSTF